MNVRLIRYILFFTIQHVCFEHKLKHIHKVLPLMYPVLSKYIYSFDPQGVRFTESIHFGVQQILREREIMAESIQHCSSLHF